MLKQAAERFDVEFISYCLMTNHIHLVAIPRQTDSLARAVGEAHRQYTRMINFRDHVRGYLFQGRFYSCPVNTGDYLFTAVRYVEQNPLRAGLVRHPWEYPWSSAAFHCGLIDKDILVGASPLLEEIGDWESFLSEEPEESSLNLQEAVRTGRPFGSDSFYSIVEKVTGRDARRRKAGRSKKN